MISNSDGENGKIKLHAESYIHVHIKINNKVFKRV